MTLRAGSDLAGGGHLVRVLQGEACRAVIEFAISPGGDGMTCRAGGCRCREIGGDVIRDIATKRLGFIPVGLMTA